jgi:hypothetical protein
VLLPLVSLLLALVVREVQVLAPRFKLQAAEAVAVD